MQDGRTTLTQFIIEEQRHVAGATGDFTGLLNDIATACKVISNAVSKGALIGLLGNAGAENVQGEVQKKLDVISNDVMIKSNEWAGHLVRHGLRGDGRHLPHLRRQRRAASTCWSSIRSTALRTSTSTSPSAPSSPSCARPTPASDAKLEDFLQPGTQQVCAGFALYGPSTLLIITTGHGVNGFTLDREVGEFILTHPNMRIPEDTQEFAINASNERFWEWPVKRYVDECLAGKTGPRGKDFNMRWIASMVAETYRILTRGGVFMYPKDTKDPSKPGRLRLLYEANPVGFIVEQAGGLCTTGLERMLDVQPTSLHQRVPLIFGSKNEVERIERYHRELRAAA